jgi:hypothetical protein
VARQKELLTLKAISEETGISQATLAKYAADNADIPSEGEGRSKRYPRAAVKVFQRLRKESKPGRRAGGSSPSLAKAPARKVPGRPPRAATGPAPAPALSIPSTVRLEPATLSLEPLRLADEDRELLRNLVAAMGGVEGQLRALSMSVGAIETELAAMGSRTASNPPASRHNGPAPNPPASRHNGPPPKYSGKRFERPRARHSQPGTPPARNPAGGDNAGNG